jgi:SHS2 domain-containing protein
MVAAYTLEPHTADVAVEATGDSVAAVFGALADGLAAAHVETIPEGGREVSVDVQAESRTALLFDYLDRLLYVRDVEGVLPVDNAVEIDEVDGEWALEGTARGVPVAGLGAREVKAITYSEMELVERDGDVHGYVVLDV